MALMSQTSNALPPESALQLHAASVPPGSWAVGVSGGADSVALLRLLNARGDLGLHVVHLNHEARGPASDADAGFVCDLAAQFQLSCTVMRISEVEQFAPPAEANRSARFRAARLALFRHVAESAGLNGVILAHHADDQAETVLQRLLRGASPEGLAGMSAESRLAGLLIVRPLLGASRDQLRQYLASIDQSWREDASNESDQYTRNRLRKLLNAHPRLRPDLLSLSQACRELRDWARDHAPPLSAVFACSALGLLPPLLARESARRWLLARGVPARQMDAAAIHQLITMAQDAASPPRQQFSGNILVARRHGEILVKE